MKQKVFSTLIASTMTLAIVAPQAQALTFTYSDKTEKIAPYIGFRPDFNVGPLNFSGGIGGTWELSSFVDPLPKSESFQNKLTNSISSGTLPSTKDLLDTQVFNFDGLLDLDANLGFNFKVADVAGLTTTVTPYLGWRHMFTATTGPSANDLINATSLEPSAFGEDLLKKSRNSNLGGLNYGGKVNVAFLNGLLSLYGVLGATTLMTGSMSENDVSTEIKTNGMTLPRLGAGAAVDLKLLRLYAGYEGVFLPNDLRLATELTNGTTTVHTFNVGFNIGFGPLGFGI